MIFATETVRIHWCSSWCNRWYLTTYRHWYIRWGTETNEDIMAYTEAKDVRSPREHWRLIEVLEDQGERGVEDDEGRWSLGIDEWDGDRLLGAELYGVETRP